MSTSIGFDIFARDRASAPMGRVGASATALDGKFNRLRSAGTMGARGFDNMARGAARLTKAVGTGLLVGLGAAAAAAYKLAEGAAEDDKAARLLALTSANAAGATRQQIAAQEDWISKIGLTKGIADDELRPALQRLVVATGDVSKAQQMASLAMDVSAGTGKSLDAVTTALAKAQNGSIGGLGRLGVATKDAAGDTKTLAQITDDLSNKFKGASASAADTASGKFARLKVGISELGENIGYKLLPYATRLIDFLVGPASAGAQKLWRAFERNGIDGLVGKIEKMTGTTGQLTPILDKARSIGKDLAGVFMNSVVPAFTQSGGIFDIAKAAGDKLVDVLGFLSDHASLTKGAIIGLVAVLTTAKVAMVLTSAASTAISVATGVWTAAQWLLNAALTANPVGVIVVTLAALAAGLVLAYKKSETFRAIVDGAFKGVTVAAKATFNFIKDHWKLILGILTGPIGIAVAVIATHWSTVKRAAGAVIDWFRDHWKLLLGILTGPIGAAVTVIATHWDTIKHGFNVVKDKISGAAAKIRGAVADAFASMLAPVQAVIDKIQALIDKANAARRALPGAGGAGMKRGGGPINAPSSGRTPPTYQGSKAGQSLNKAGKSLLLDLAGGLAKGKVAADRVIDAVGQRVSDMVDKVQGLADARKDYIASFAGFATSIFAADFGDQAPTLDGLMSFAKAQAANATTLNSDVQKLVSAGLSTDLLEELKEQGASGQAQIHALASGTGAQIAEFNRINAETQAQLTAAGTAVASKTLDPELQIEKAALANARALYDVLAPIIASNGGKAEDITFTLDGDVLTAVQKKKARHRGTKK